MAAIGRPSCPTPPASRRARKTGAERRTSPDWAGAPRAPATAGDQRPRRRPRSVASGFSQKMARPRAARRRPRCGGPPSGCRSRRHRSAPSARRGRPPPRPRTPRQNPRLGVSLRSSTTAMSASITPASIIACSPSPWAQAISPVPANPIAQHAPDTTGTAGTEHAHGDRDDPVTLYRSRKGTIDRLRASSGKSASMHTTIGIPRREQHALRPPAGRGRRAGRPLQVDGPVQHDPRAC